jgi:hypothetical protein
MAKVYPWPMVLIINLVVYVKANMNEECNFVGYGSGNNKEVLYQISIE